MIENSYLKKTNYPSLSRTKKRKEIQEKSQQHKQKSNNTKVQSTVHYKTKLEKKNSWRPSYQSQPSRYENQTPRVQKEAKVLNC